MEKLVCSLCGYESNQKKFKEKDINEHFDNASQVWCPRNVCKENNKEKRIVPEGYICNYWYSYGGWCTLEKDKVIDFETAKAIYRAKKLRDKGLKIIQDRTNKW